jgi:hypothetical protein
MPQPTGAPAADAPAAAVGCEWRVHRASLTFNGPVTVPAIQQLVRYIERAFDYYKYDTVEVEIDSPGGELRALNDHGGRYIHRSTELLFHFSRVSPGQQFLTAARAGQLTLALQRTDDSMLDALVAHITGRNGADCAPAVARYHATARQRLARMLEPGVLPPDEAEAALYCQQLEELAQMIGPADDPDGLLRRLRAHLHARFESEQLMGHAEAYVLNLVDHVGGLVPPRH